MSRIIPFNENNALDAQTLKADRQRRFTLYSDLKVSVCKEWLVKDWLGHAEHSVMFGKPGSGKSVLAGNIGLHVAAGWEWFGCPVRRGAVLYVAMERPTLVERRAVAFRVKHGDADLPFAIVRGPFDMKDPAIAADIIARAKEVEVQTAEPTVLIILDTLAQGLAGGDENSGKDMGAIVATTSKLIAEVKAHVMWLHHMPHDADRMRGHGSLLGAADTTILVRNSGGLRSATIEKANDAEEGKRLTFTLESVPVGEDGTTAPIIAPADAHTAQDTPSPADFLKGNKLTMYQILFKAGTAGLTQDQWYAEAREHGIGVTRRSTLSNTKLALEVDHYVRESGGRWFVKH
jgi:type III secretion system FlhB-like substrate exporter